MQGSPRFVGICLCLPISLQCCLLFEVVESRPVSVPGGIDLGKLILSLISISVGIVNLPNEKKLRADIAALYHYILKNSVTASSFFY